MRLYDWLVSNDVSDADFAERVGTSPHAVKKWRYGERIPRSVALARIVAATNGQVTANDFFPPVPEAAE